MHSWKVGRKVEGRIEERVRRGVRTNVEPRRGSPAVASPKPRERKRSALCPVWEGPRYLALDPGVSSRGRGSCGIQAYSSGRGGAHVVPRHIVVGGEGLMWYPGI